MCHVACVGKSLCEQSVIFFRRENTFSFAQNIPIGSYTAYHNFRVDAYRNVNPPPNIVKHSNERIKFRFYLNAFFVLEYCLEHFRPRKIRTLILSIVFCSFVFAKKKKNPLFFFFFFGWQTIILNVGKNRCPNKSITWPRRNLRLTTAQIFSLKQCVHIHAAVDCRVLEYLASVCWGGHIFYPKLV